MGNSTQFKRLILSEASAEISTVRLKDFKLSFKFKDSCNVERKEKFSFFSSFPMIESYPSCEIAQHQEWNWTWE